MSTELYPMKFSPIYKERVWGADNLNKRLGKKIPSEIHNCGESWEISAVEGNVSVVSNGFLAGNALDELIEIYMGELVGDKVFEKFGVEFPLLIKLIDANDTLSIQVHPNDAVASERHHAYGKTEMWYVISAQSDAKIYCGFNRDLTAAEYKSALDSKSLKDVLNADKVETGDVFYIPAGRVHAIGKGVMLAEIQQTSDVTYRIYDWDRVGLDGKPRELHTDLALDVIDFKKTENPKYKAPNLLNKTSELVHCPYFTVNRLRFNSPIKRDYALLDSFVIFLCVSGSVHIDYGQEQKVEVVKGETVLIPAELSDITLYPQGETIILETYVD
ncbi:MAG: class I mannose-6-phosphate isomerase [Bacteroidales bacterium]|nr:class I mannose-6-phosphate isomerase [Bacteroidales bacterium]HPD94313.1 mannose-6-phosphate isomerase [Tenuifilaceae bacterium]HRX30361.1 mannose-6-phosphate isomerase [Tenuifilaceae bacterium]